MDRETGFIAQPTGKLGRCTAEAVDTNVRFGQEVLRDELPKTASNTGNGNCSGGVHGHEEPEIENPSLLFRR